MISSLDLGMHRIQIRVVEGLEVDGQASVGVWDYKEMRIDLEADQSPKDMGSTLLHELLHVISDFYGLDFSETMVHTLETAMMELIHRKPQLVQVLLGAVAAGNQIRTESGGTRAILTPEQPDPVKQVSSSPTKPLDSTNQGSW